MVITARELCFKYCRFLVTLIIFNGRMFLKRTYMLEIDELGNEAAGCVGTAKSSGIASTQPLS